jgi:hypothetical protein
MKLADISGIKRGNIRKKKLMSLQRIVRTRTSENCIRKKLDLRGATDREITYVKDEIGDVLADSNKVLNRWKNYVSQLLNVHNVSDVRQIEEHTTVPLVPIPSRFDV